MSETLLSTHNLVKNIGSRTLLDSLTFGLETGARLGLIGDNGTGKSTLLRLLAGAMNPDGGTVSRRQGLRTALLEQVPQLPRGTLLAALEEPFAPVRAAIAAYERDPSGAQAAAQLAEIDRLGGWDFTHRVARAASSLGIDRLNRQTTELSGGYKKRVALAQMVLQQPELVLLDEPTNHLDTETVEWLEAWLATGQTTAVVVTHDRMFLDKVVDRMGELRDGHLRLYTGNYADYVAARATEEALAARSTARQQRILAQELEWASRAPQARTTKSRARLDRIEVAQASLRAAAPQLGSTDSMALGAPARLGKTILELQDVTYAHSPGQPLFAPFSLILTAGQRYGIVGPNGAGKSSLLRLVTGELTPTGGTVTHGINTQVAYFDQHRSNLRAEASLRETLTPAGGDMVYPNGQAMHVAAWLGRFAFATERLQMRVGQLSGGEKNRLALAKFMLTRANVLLMDEPTNDLDLFTLGILEAAISAYTGCMMVVSHDRAFLDRIVTGIIAFESAVAPTPGWRLNTVQGSYSHYTTVRPKVRRHLPGGGSEGAPQARATATKMRQSSRAPKPLTFKQRQALSDVEAAITEDEALIAQLEAQLADPDSWKREGGKANLRCTEALAAAQAQLSDRFARWEVLQEQKDASDQAQARGRAKP